MATLLSREMSRDLYDAYIKHERFILSVRALTGWPESRAKALLRRINKIAESSRYDSAETLKEEWQRRYVMGWDTPETRRRVIVKKAARKAFA